MLEQLFSSRTRVKLLRLFINNPEQSFFTREITRTIRGHIHSVRRELDNLTKIGFLKTEGVKTKKFYRVDSRFPLFRELKNVFFKAQIFYEGSALQKLAKTDRVQAVLLTGYFTDQTATQTDILIVGRINKAKVKRLIAAVQKEIERPIKYTMMSRVEFHYRQNLTDRFLITILELPHIIIYDKLGIT